MAYETGTATSHVDFYNKLFTFLTTNADLVAANQQWERITTVGQAPPWSRGGDTTDSPAYSYADVMLKGPGLSQQDEIFVSMRLMEDTSTLNAIMAIRGHNGVRGSIATYDDHINTSHQSTVPLNPNTSVQYWMVASGRRFYFVLKYGTIYLCGYAGLYLPYALPDGNPYPLCIGGVSGQTDLTKLNVNSTGTVISFFPDPSTTGSTDGGYQFQAVLPGGQWKTFACNQSDTDYDISTSYNARLFPYNLVSTTMGPGEYGRLPHGAWGSFRSVPDWGNYYYERWRGLLENFVRPQNKLLGGGVMLTPIVLHASAPEGTGVFGVLDGVFQVPGTGVFAGDTIQYDGDDHLVVQNIYRTQPHNYAAFRLE